MVDQANCADSQHVVKNMFPEVKLIVADKNRGYGSGINLGAKQVRGKYLLVCNPDITFLEGSIKAMRDYLAKNKKVAVLAPKLIYPDGMVQENCRRFYKISDIIYRRSPLGRLPWARRQLASFLLKDYDRKKPMAVDWVTFACFMVKGDLFKKIGGMDERYFLFFEDTDLCRTVWSRGWEVHYLPDAEVIHNHRRLTDGHSLKLLFRRVTWIHISSAIRYFRKWGRKVRMLKSGKEL